MAHQSNKVTASVTSFSLKPDIKDPPDTLPHDRQPPGVDEEIEYDSLEEALTS